MKKLLIVSGADRTGKSTFCNNLKIKPFHFSVPKETDTHIFQMYRECLQDNEDRDYIVFDRSWVCAYILEDFRRHATNHVLDVFGLETELMLQGWDIFHLGFSRSWQWVAKSHIKELLGENLSDWRLRDKLYERNQEHIHYEKTMRYYFENVTLFPSKIFDNSVQAYLFANEWLSQ